MNRIISTGVKSSKLSHICKGLVPARLFCGDTAAKEAPTDVINGSNEISCSKTLEQMKKRNS